jgi:hypothetical protein
MKITIEQASALSRLQNDLCVLTHMASKMPIAAHLQSAIDDVSAIVDDMTKQINIEIDSEKWK